MVKKSGQKSQQNWTKISEKKKMDLDFLFFVLSSLLSSLHDFLCLIVSSLLSPSHVNGHHYNFISNYFHKELNKTHFSFPKIVWKNIFESSKTRIFDRKYVFSKNYMSSWNNGYIRSNSSFNPILRIIVFG